jgi:hypothetical protein
MSDPQNPPDGLECCGGRPNCDAIDYCRARRALTAADIDSMLQDRAQGSKEFHDFAREVERRVLMRIGYGSAPPLTAQ